MTIYKILKYPHSLLRKKSTDVTVFDAGLQLFSENLCETMYVFDGIGLAAPQVGILKRVIVVDVRKYFKDPDIWKKTVEYSLDGVKMDCPDVLTLVNPVIKVAKDTIIFPLDGCLSFPGVPRAKTERSAYIEIEAYDTQKRLIHVNGYGIMSICLQHEMDHLEGVLFIDRVQEEAFLDEELLGYIKDHEDESEERKKIKKYKPQDARRLVSIS